MKKYAISFLIFVAAEYLLFGLASFFRSWLLSLTSPQTYMARMFLHEIQESIRVPTFLIALAMLFFWMGYCVTQIKDVDSIK